MVCHTDESGLKTAHDKVELGDQKKKAKLKKTTVPEEVCAACHNKAELTEKTASSTVLTDSNGLCVNPHDIPVNDGHAEADIACSSCHKMHEEQNVEETAPKVCLNCHHADVYECNTCHLEK